MNGLNFLDIQYIKYNFGKGRYSLDLCHHESSHYLDVDVDVDVVVVVVVDVNDLLKHLKSIFFMQLRFQTWGYIFWYRFCRDQLSYKFIHMIFILTYACFYHIFV